MGYINVKTDNEKTSHGVGKQGPPGPLDPADVGFSRKL